MRDDRLPLAIRRGSLGVKREIWVEQLRLVKLTQTTALLCRENISTVSSTAQEFLHEMKNVFIN